MTDPRAGVLTAAFVQAYDRPPVGVWSAPGRVNLIGEHTDYNDGFVLPLALQRTVLVAAAPAAAGSTAKSTQLPEVASWHAPQVGPGDVPGWAAYVAGVVWAARVAGHPVRDVDLLVDSDVPLGAGLSSSGALGCAAATALLELAGEVLDRSDVALLARRSENEFVGAPTGVMDQLASMHGRAGHVILIDTRSLEVEPIPFDPAAHGLALLVVDTHAPHRLVDGRYAERRASCERATEILGVTALRDVDVEGLPAALARLPDRLLARRVRHVVTESARVLDVADTLRTGGDPRRIGVTLTASHASLRDDFEVTVPELDLAVDVALATGAHGARMTGGGFGGCIVALVDADAPERVMRAVRTAFAGAGHAAPAGFLAIPSDGARRIT